MDDFTRMSEATRSIQRLAQRTGLTSILDELGIDENIQLAGGARVVVVGGVNVGKSTLINALVGRDVLPISLARSTVGISIYPGNDEAVQIDGQRLPLTAVKSTRATAHSADILVTLSNKWLEAGDLRLVERAPLDASDADLDSMIEASLRSADAIVIVIDALMPVTRTDAAVLVECADRWLPVIVALSKGNHLAAEERVAVLEHVERHVASAGLDSPVIDTEAMGGIERLRGAIDESVAVVDLVGLRLRRRRRALLSALKVLELAAQAGLEIETTNARDREFEGKKRQYRVEAEALEWAEIEQRLSASRQKLDEWVRGDLERSCAAIRGEIFADLERTEDVRQWWERDLPARLQRELRAVFAQVSGTISDHVARDIRWAQDELDRLFRISRVAEFGQPRVDVGGVAIEPPSISLSKTRALRIASRIGTAATLVLAGVALTHAGWAGAALAAPALAGLAADEIARRVAAKDRDAVRLEVERLLQRAWLDYSTQISAELRSSYDAILSTVKAEQETWRRKQLAVAPGPPAARDSIDWQHVLGEIARLVSEIDEKED